jgi:hypothetical protein
MTTTTKPRTTDAAAAADPVWQAYAKDRPSWWRPLASNPWPGSRRAYPCPWGCNGTGKLLQFRHIANGVCFGCKGRGWLYGLNEVSGVEAAIRHRQAPAPTERQPLRHWRRIGGRIEQVGES